jgi:hypothetical protein
MNVEFGARIDFPNGWFSLDKQSGAIAAAQLTGTGTNFIKHHSGVGLARIAIPHADFPAHHVELGTHGQPAMEPLSDAGVRLVYSELETIKGLASVQAEIDLESSEQGLRIRARVQNLGSEDIPQVVFPQIFGLQNISGKDNTRIQLGRGRLYPFRDIDVRPDDAHFLEVHRQRYLPYGNREHSLKWLDFGSSEGGFALYSCDTRYTTQGLVIERSVESPDEAAIRWVHYPFIRPGETWDSGDFVLYAHPGDWYAGARAYQQFATVHYPYNAPEHIQQALGIRTIWPAVRGELPTFPFSQIDEFAEEIADPALGLAELCVWHWWLRNGYPVEIDSRLGTEEDLKESLERCQQHGVPVSLFVSHHLLRDVEETNDSRVHLNSALQRVAQNWTYGLGFVPRFAPSFSGTHAMSQGSALSPGWRDTGLEEYRKILELGATSICFDQFRAWPEPNFNPAVDGRPDEEGEKLLMFALEARRLIHARNPTGTFSGEHITDVKMPVLDYTWEWKNKMADAGPFRYVFPQFRLNVNINEHPRGALLGFMEGALLNVIPGNMRSYRLRDCPDLVTMLKQLALLRRRFLPYFTTGQFRFVEGLTVQGGKARIYTHDDSVLVIATNPGDEPSDVMISIDQSVWGAMPVCGMISEFDINGREVDKSSAEGPTFHRSARLEADSLRIFEYIPVR